MNRTLDSFVNPRDPGQGIGSSRVNFDISDSSTEEEEGPGNTVDHESPDQQPPQTQRQRSYTNVMHHPTKFGIQMKTVKERHLLGEGRNARPAILYSPLGSNDPRVYRKCMRIEGDKMCKCEFRNSDTAGFLNHECKWTTITSPFTATLPVRYNNKQLMAYFSLFLAEARISFNSASSHFFRLFVDELVAQARNFPPKSSKEIRQEVVQYADHHFLEQMNALEDCNISIALDAGTIHQHHFIVFMLLRCDQKPQFFKAVISQQSYTTLYYANEVEKIVRQLHSEHIHVDAIVSDGLPAQLNAIDGRHEDCIQKRANGEPAQQQILFCTCLCHALNVLIRESLEHTSLKEHYTNLQQISQLLRSSSLKPKCPQFISTRWLYLLDILTYIEGHLDSVESLAWTPDQQTTILAVSRLKKIIEPVMRLIRTFESDQTQITSVVPEFLAAITQYYDIIEEYAAHRHRDEVQLCYSLADHLTHFLEHAPENWLYSLAFVLTHEGRVYIRGPQTPIEVDILNTQRQKRVHIEQHQLHPLPVVPSLLQDAGEIRRRKQKIKYPMLAELYNKPLSSRTQRVKPPPLIALERVLQLNHEDRKKECFAKLRKALQSCAVTKILQLSQHLTRPVVDVPKGNSIEDALTFWLDKPHSEIDRYLKLKNGDAEFWRFHKAQESRFADLGGIALLLFRLPTSEASCERAISKMRLMVGAHRTTMNEKTLNALMRLYYSNLDE